MPKSNLNPPKDPVELERQKYDSRYQNRDQKAGYGVGTWEFPEGLRVKPDLQHYVAFYVNVREKSSEGIRNKNKDYLVSEDEQNRIDAIDAAGSRTSIAAAQAAQGVFKQYAGRIVAGATLLGAGLTSGIKGIGRAAIPAVASGLLAATVTDVIDKQKFNAFASGRTRRIKEVITLHVEQSPSVKYGANYTQTDVAGLLGLGGIFIQGSAAATAKNLEKFAPEAQARFLSELSKLPALGSGGGIISDLRELSSKTRTNPFKETLFESVDYRTFNFRYRFFPKNASESQKIKDIIRTFKVHMHPELTAGRLFYIYPSEFDIQYFYKDKENDYFHKFTRCALTDMQIDYGGEQFATFQDGSPVEIGLQLTFTELEQLTSEGIDKYGY
jgi:hypothetical protein